MRLRALASLLLVTLFACGSDGPDGPVPVTPERIQAVCEEWSRVGCEKNMECASEEDLAACLAGAVPQCVYDANAEQEDCQGSRLAAMESCAESLEQMTCEEYCGEDGGFCFQYCPYFC